MRFTNHLIAFAALPFAAPASAQITKSGNVYYVTANHTLGTDLSGSDVLVGVTAETPYVPGTVTLTITSGAKITGSKTGTPLLGVNNSGLTVFGDHRLILTGGTVSTIRGSGKSVITIGGGTIGDLFAVGALNMSGGNIEYANIGLAATANIGGGNIKQIAATSYSTTNLSGGNFPSVTASEKAALNITGGTTKHADSRGFGLMSISGGTVTYVTGNNEGMVSITGGTVTNATGYGNSKSSIGGGTLPNGFQIASPKAALDFVGRNLSVVYKGYAYNKPYAVYADGFAVTGTFGRETKTYTVYIRNTDGAKGKTNSAVRQFTFNGKAPVAAVMPEKTRRE